MQSKPLNFLYNIGQRNSWLIPVVTVLLLILKLLGQLPYSDDGFGFSKISELPGTIDRILHFAAFGRTEYIYVSFYSQLTYCITVLTWVLLIAGIIRYYGQKHSATVLKLVTLFILWQGLFDVVRLVYFKCVNPFDLGDFLEPYFFPSVILLKIALPILLSVLLLALLSPTKSQATETPETTTTFNRGQRGFHYFIDRLFIWFCGYNTYLMIGFSTGKTAYPFIGLALFLTQLIIFPLVSEWFFGITLTKIITGSEVVRTDGKPISFSQALARSFIRIIPFGWVSVFTKTPWIDAWTGTEVRYFSKDEPLLRLHKCVQLGTTILFFCGLWFLAIALFVLLRINGFDPTNDTPFFPFFVLLIGLSVIPFLQSFWLATVVSYYRTKRDGSTRHSTEIIRAAFCWIPIQNFFHLGSYLEEITSHMEHLGVSEEDNDRIATKIRRFSNVFGLTSTFILGLFFPLLINPFSENTFIIAGLICALAMIYAFFAWDFSRALKNTVVKTDAVSELIDDLG